MRFDFQTMSRLVDFEHWTFSAMALSIFSIPQAILSGIWVVLHEQRQIPIHSFSWEAISVTMVVRYGHPTIFKFHRISTFLIHLIRTCHVLEQPYMTDYRLVVIVLQINHSSTREWHRILKRLKIQSRKLRRPTLRGISGLSIPMIQAYLVLLTCFLCRRTSGKSTIGGRRLFGRFFRISPRR